MLKLLPCFVWLLSGMLLTAASAKPTRGIPSYVDYSLAGANLTALRAGQSVVKRNIKRGHYLVATNSDGSCKTLILAADKNDVEGYRPAQARAASFTSSTGRGVALGDSVKRVRQKLGKPSRSVSPDGGEMFYEYSYEGAKLNATGGKGKGWSYSATYSFHKGRLNYIRFVFQRGSSAYGDAN
jgi:hypothetical protein